jgi:hypothetical protein
MLAPFDTASLPLIIAPTNRFTNVIFVQDHLFTYRILSHLAPRETRFETEVVGHFLSLVLQHLIYFCFNLLILSTNLVNESCEGVF